jgi:AAA15 family ATPase/GTPase
MIKELSVKNFKSIKELEIDCRRVNLFIGEPNTGKSNILETLGLLSWCGHKYSVPLKDYVRFRYADNLFYDNSIDGSSIIMIEKDPKLPPSTKGEEARSVEMSIAVRNEISDFNVSLDSSPSGRISLNRSGESHESHGVPNQGLEFVKFYRFKRDIEFKGNEISFLMPPVGSNMFAVVSVNKKLRGSVAGFFRDFGFKLMLRTQEKEFEFLKEIDDVIFNYPYILCSDTLQRLIFYTVAIESNENSTLIFEEPEVHAFPEYIVYMGRKIAFDEKNQYFIATHNPYFLLSILEKAPKDDVNVFVTYFEDYQTKVKCLNDEEMSELMVYDPFGNLDRLIGRLESFVEEEEQ